MKSKEVLEDFVEYCKKNPELRFWQALRNWSEYAFIWGSHVHPDEDSGQEWITCCLEDTFYKETK